MRFSLSLLALVCCSWPASAATSYGISCEAEYGGHTEQIKLHPAADAFSFQSVSLQQRFRFQAQWLPQRGKLKTLLYERRGQSFALLHSAEYPLGQYACPIETIDFGLNKVYAAELEREIFYQCKLRCE